MSPEAVGRTGQGERMRVLGEVKGSSVYFERFRCGRRRAVLAFSSVTSAASVTDQCRSPALPDTPGPRVISGTRLTEIDRVHVS